MSLPPPQQIDPSKTPLALNPNGAPPNFDNPPSLSGSILAVGLTLCIVSAALVVLRLITNSRGARKLRPADYLCVLSFVLMTCYFALIDSLGDTARHTWDVPLSFLTTSFIKKACAENFIIGPALWFSKAAILALYLQLFGRKLWLRWTCYLALIITFCFFWVSIPLTGVYCVPRNGAQWNANSLSSCEKLAVLGPIHGAVGVAADLLIFCLPLPVISNLNLPLRKKIGLAAVFLVGIFGLVASCVSLYYRVKTYTGSDSLWNGSRITICTFAECYVTIIVSCTPAISSFWINFVAKSAFYSKLSGFYSSLISSRASRSRKAKDRSPTVPKDQQPPGSTTRLNDRQGHYELNGGSYGRPATKIHSLTVEPFRQEGIITKSTAIYQQFESRGD